MSASTRLAIYAICPLVIGLGFAGDARANHLENCNGIFLEAEAAGSCKVVTTEECEVECKPVAMEMVCASRLTTSCQGSCTAEAEVECRSGCEETCVPNCMDAEEPNCMGLGMADCQQACNADCDTGECRSQCAHICSSDCHPKCENEDPEPICEPVCETACWGSCEGRANVECQMTCQADSFTSCKTDVAEECTEECETTGAAIFCDGQFLATAEDLDACAADLEDAFDIHLEFEAEAEGSADATGSLFACSIDPKSGRDAAPFGLLSFLGGLLWLRKRRQPRAS